MLETPLPWPLDRPVMINPMVRSRVSFVVVQSAQLPATLAQITGCTRGMSSLGHDVIAERKQHDAGSLRNRHMEMEMYVHMYPAEGV
jgi:hypothetical protein